MGPSRERTADRRHSSGYGNLLLDAVSPRVLKPERKLSMLHAALTWSSDFWKMDLLCLHATFKIHGHSKFSSQEVLNVLDLSKLAILLGCNRYRFCPSLAPGRLCTIFQMCLCNACAAWTADC